MTAIVDPVTPGRMISGRGTKNFSKANGIQVLRQAIEDNQTLERWRASARIDRDQVFLLI